MRKPVIKTWALTVVASVPMLACAGQASAQDGLPTLVAAYARQLAGQCGPVPPGAPVPSIVERADLNGDNLDDYIVDASRYPCPGRPSLAADAGSQVTVFKGVAGGVVVPAFQRAGFGARLQRVPGGAPKLWVTLAGSECGAGSPARCERQVLWRAERFELAEPTKAPAR